MVQVGKLRKEKMMRFKKGFFVTATDTEVGKTFFCALLIRALNRKGIDAGYFKPAASGCSLEKGHLVSDDILYVEGFTGKKMDHDMHCPVRYEKPLAPLAAAQLENRPFNLDAVWKSFDLLKERYPVVIVEGIGGVMVPLKEDYLLLDLIAETFLPAIVVCRPVIGTINHSLLTLHALKRRGIALAGFLTNGHVEEDDEVGRTSPLLIAKFSQVPYLGHIPLYDPEKDDPDSFIEQKAGFLKNLPL
jgi:dethiobiotin synthetase